MSAFNFGRSGSADGRDARPFAGRGASLRVEGSGVPSTALKPRDRHYRASLAVTGVLTAALLSLFSANASAAPVLGDPCPNGDIRKAQGVSKLPDCMALEKVSPGNKGNQHTRMPRAIADGKNRVLFNSIAALGTCIGVNTLTGDLHLATRGESGWTHGDCVTPPYDVLGFAQPSFLPDLSGWFHLGSIGEPAYRRGLGNFISPISPPIFNVTGALFGAEPQAVGASEDHSRVYIRPASVAVTWLPGGPLPAGTGADANVYIAGLDSSGQPSLELLARDRDGKDWGGNCGARLGGMTSSVERRNHGAISPDGDSVYFSTRPAQPEAGNCNQATNKLRIMVREEAPTGVAIEELIESECNRPALPDPPGPCKDIGDDFYEGASVDQTLVYFTTNRQLVDGDIDGTASSCSRTANVVGCDLYLYDSTRPTGTRLTQVSAGDGTAATPGSGANVRPSITAISADGSHVYFVAQSKLTENKNPEGAEAQSGQNNLYVYKHPDEELAFIGALAATDGGTNGLNSLFGGLGNWQNAAYAVPIGGGAEGGDGHILVFRSIAPLTADDADSSRDLFRYDTEAHTLERVSIAAPGGSDGGAFDVRHRGDSSPASIGTDYANAGRWVSEDGETVTFTTVEGLVPEDQNGVQDAYFWRKGDIYRLPGGARLNNNLRENTPVVSRDGSMIAYHSVEQLLPSDGDSAQDVYAARVLGGFPFPSNEIVCQGEDCQGAATTAPDAAGAASAGFSGRGNLKSRANCGEMARRARNLSRRAKSLRRKAGQVHPDRANRLHARAKRLSKQAGKLSRNAKRCRRASREVGR